MPAERDGVSSKDGRCLTHPKRSDNSISQTVAYSAGRPLDIVMHRGNLPL